MDDATLRLFDDFAARRARGERPDPLAYLEQAGGFSDELAMMIDALARTAPPPGPAAAALERVRSLLSGETRLLRLRLRAGLTVEDVHRRLMSEFELDVMYSDKLRDAYQKLESGVLDAAHIDPRLGAALARMMGFSREELAIPGRDESTGYALVTSPVERSEALGGPAAIDPGPGVDEIDRLFGMAA